MIIYIFYDNIRPETDNAMSSAIAKGQFLSEMVTPMVHKLELSPDLDKQILHSFPNRQVC